MGSIVPASGAGGLALGAWILHEGGMPAERIARRSVAFFLIKSSVNFVAVVVIGTLMALGLIGPHRSLLADRAAGRAARRSVIRLVLLMPRLGARREGPGDAGRVAGGSPSPQSADRRDRGGGADPALGETGR